MTNCPQPIGYFLTPEGKKIPAPCKQWNCPICSKVKKNKVLDKAGTGFSILQYAGNRVRSLCLTLGPRADNESMGKYFARFRAWLAKPRKYGKRKRSYRNIKYFWTKEFQKNGQLHLHILINVYIPVDVIRAAWEWATYGTSRIVFITKINNEIRNPAGYMTKYMTKELEQSHEFRYKERRYGFSRGKVNPFKAVKTTWVKQTGLSFTYSPSTPEIQKDDVKASDWKLKQAQALGLIQKDI